MSLRMMIFEGDAAERDQLVDQLTCLGHDVVAFPGPSRCPVFRFRECLCDFTGPCADVLVVGQDLPHINGIDFLALQNKRGCKVLPENKILISSRLTELQTLALKPLGVHSLRKPYASSSLLDWVRQCENRLFTACQPAEMSTPA